MEHRIVADYACQTGENPLWHPVEEKLYWTDIPAGRLFRYDPRTGSSQTVYQDRPVGGFTIQADGSLLLFRDRGNIVRWEQGRVTHTVVEEIPDERSSRFNDVLADPEGRVYGGTMATPERYGRLYRLDPDGRCRVMVEEVGTPNGMGFTLDGKHFLFTDSPRRVIWLYDYERSSGVIRHGRVFIRLEEEGPTPDGLTIDAAGDVWIALYGGSGLLRVGPDGGFKERIDLPARKITSVTFAGDSWGQLYVTSAGGAHREEDPRAGVLFQLSPDVGGRPEHFSRIAAPSPRVAPDPVAGRTPATEGDGGRG